MSDPRDDAARNPFVRFDPNPFRVNAFTLTGMRVGETGPANIHQAARVLELDIETGKPRRVPLADGRAYEATATDVSEVERCLREPLTRAPIEWLVSRDHEPVAIPGAAEYSAAHNLTARSADAFLETIETDLTPIVLAVLPPPPEAVIAAVATTRATIPSPALPASALLVSRRHRHVRS